MGNLAFAKEFNITRFNRRDRNSRRSFNQTRARTSLNLYHKIDGTIEKANYIAIYEFNQKENGVCPLLKWDLLLVTDTDNQHWYLSENLRTNKVGYVPASYIKQVNNLDIKVWFFTNCTRDEARLMLMENIESGPGLFLIRNMQSYDNLTLSVLDYTDEQGYNIKNYHILKNEKSYYISQKKFFSTLDELISFHQEAAHGLCRKLTKPCPKNSFSERIREEPIENVETIRLLGAGLTGEVYEALWKGQFKVTIRNMKINNIDKYIRETIINGNNTKIKVLRHQNIIKLLFVCHTRDQIYLATEYMPNGALNTYLQKHDGRFATFSDLVDISEQIIDGMKYIEDRDCVHRNLAAHNILVGHKNLVKIGDFGIAPIVDENGRLEVDNKLFVVRWSAPELFTLNESINRKFFTIKADIWSFGVVLYEIFTFGETPYQNMSYKEIVHKILNENYRLPNPGFASNAIYSIMVSCWQLNPEKRPTFSRLKTYFEENFH